MSNTNIKLTKSQEAVLKQLKDFVFRSEDRVFILKGYAGTGKTTLMRFLIEALEKKEERYRLLSTTGRAAKILANHTDREATTIHSMIYRYKDFNKDLSNIDDKKASVDETGQLFLVFEPTVLSTEDRNRVVYIIDESSMISDMEDQDITQAKFGSGRILKELLDYDPYSESKFIFVGDPCQLPPILGTISPALTPAYFEQTFGLQCQEGNLTEIMRQDNSIIAAGAYLRKLWNTAPENENVYGTGVWGPALQLSAYGDVKIHFDISEMEQLYLQNIHEKGYTDSTFICSSNANCMKMSQKIRSSLGFSGSVQVGDLLMVTQNQLQTGLMNGDMVEVVGLSAETERTFKTVQTPDGYQTELIFREIQVKELFTNKVYSTLLMETILNESQVNLNSRQQSGLFLDFVIRMKRKGITQKKDKEQFDKAMRLDPYLNALRCNYGYAITCHKSQGGEWNNVYIQMPRNITRNPTKNKYQWFYTALTRAKYSVHICKDFFIK